MSACDPYFRVEVLAKTNRPQQVVYAALRQDYSEEFVYDEFSKETYGPPEGWWTDPFAETELLTEEKAGERVVKNLLKGNRGHYGPLEHPQIVFNIGWFPHSTMQQLRTHRVGVSFDVQSFRYTGKRIIDVAENKCEIEKVFYLRPAGNYTDRSGKKYTYSEDVRSHHKQRCFEAAYRYKTDVESGFSEEHARGLIPFDIRQHWVMSCNLRSLMHLLDLRWKADAQLECQQLCDLLAIRFKEWCPEIYSWYEENRAKKARLAP